MTSDRKNLWVTRIVQSAMEIEDSKTNKDIELAITMIEIAISCIKAEMQSKD